MIWFKRAPLFSAEISRYLESAAFKTLKPETKKSYKYIYRNLVIRFGRLRVNRITTETVEAMMAEYIDRPGTANSMLYQMRARLQRCVSRGDISRDPTQGVKPLRLGTFHTWTEPEIAQFEARWPRLGTGELIYRKVKGQRGRRSISSAMARLAFDLYLWTDQRRTDIAKMAWSDFYAERLYVRQSKTGTELSLPFHRRLKLSLEGFPRGNATIIVTPTGRAFTPAELSYAMAAAIDAAGLPERCTPHGLRKALMRRLAELEASGSQLKSVSGHRSLKDVSTYTEAADQRKLSDSAFALFDKNQEV